KLESTWGYTSGLQRNDLYRTGHAPRHTDVAALGPMAQRVIHQDQRQQGLGDGRGPYADAGVMPAMGFDHDGIALQIDGTPRRANARGGLDGQGHGDRLAAGDAAQDASGMIAQK